MSVNVAAPPSETLGRLPFLLRALGAIRVNDDGTPFKKNTPEDADSQAEDEKSSENSYLEDVDFAHQHRNYKIIHVKPLPLPTDPTAEFDSTPLELPQLTDQECRTEVERIFSYEGEGEYPWEQINSKIVEGVTLLHINEHELAQWNMFRDCRIECMDVARGPRQPVPTEDIEYDKTWPATMRRGLNDLLWWAVAIDICCGIEELDGFFEGCEVKEMTLGFFNLGFTINIVPVHELTKDVPKRDEVVS